MRRILYSFTRALLVMGVSSLSVSGEVGGVDIYYTTNTRAVRMSKSQKTGELSCEISEMMSNRPANRTLQVSEDQMNGLVRTCSTKMAKFIYPGTLWCGVDNNADSYADLGEEVEADICCRDHDTCKPSIPAFRSKFGLTNIAIWTKNHCRCDRQFHACLTAAATNTSENVGWWFFNLFDIECFEKRRPMKCVEYDSDGSCRRWKPNRSKPKKWSFVDLDLSF